MQLEGHSSVLLLPCEYDGELSQAYGQSHHPRSDRDKMEGTEVSDSFAQASCHGSTDSQGSEPNALFKPAVIWRSPCCSSQTDIQANALSLQVLYQEFRMNTLELAGVGEVRERAKAMARVRFCPAQRP